MSNLTRKIKKANENPSKARRRSKKRYEKRLAAQTTKMPWLSPADARIKLTQNLPLEIQEACTTDLGVFDLDKLDFILHIKWEKGSGWFPHWSCKVKENSSEKAHLTSNQE